MPGPDSLLVEPNSLKVLPGNYAEATIRVQNTSDVVDVLSVTIYGLDPSWVQLSTISFSLFPGDLGTSVLKISVPRTAESLSKSYLATVETKSRNFPFCPQKAELVLEVDPFHCVEASVREEIVGSGRSSYLIDVQNHGNAPVTFGFAGIPSRGKWQFAFTPTQIEIAAGAAKQLKASVFTTLNDRPKLGLRQNCECELKVQPIPANGSSAIVTGHLRTSPVLHLWVTLCLLMGIACAVVILSFLVL